MLLTLTDSIKSLLRFLRMVFTLLVLH